MFGALLVAAAVVGMPVGARAAVACRDNGGWWCLYGKPNLRDGGGLIGTNNGDTDLRMNEGWSWFNGAARSVSNRSKSYVGLYDDIDFRGLMACLPPNTQLVDLPAGLSSLRIHPGRDAACTGSGRPKRPDTEPAATSGVPSLRAPAAPPVNAAATEPAAGKDGGTPWGSVVGTVAVLVTSAALGIGGWVFRRRRLAAVPVPRAAADPRAAHHVHLALLLLAIDCEQEQRALPKVRAVTIDDTDVTLHLAAREERAPQPWTAPDPERWRLSITGIDELPGQVDVPVPYPLLAMVQPGMWVNLAAVPGPIALAGNRNAARKAALGLARWLRESPWHESVRVRTLGFPPEASIEPEAGTERARVVFVNDGVRVPAKTRPGSAVIVVGRPERAGTIWRVRSDGSIVPPADVQARGPAAAAADPDAVFADFDAASADLIQAGRS